MIAHIFTAIVLCDAYTIRLKLGTIPKKDILVKNTSLGSLEMIKVPEGFYLKRNTEYLSYDTDKIVFNDKKNIFKFKENMLGTQLLLNGKCVTVSKKTLVLDECFSDQEFKSIYQSFVINYVRLTKREDIEFDKSFLDEESEIVNDKPFLDLEKKQEEIIKVSDKKDFLELDMKNIFYEDGIQNLTK